MKRKKFKNSIFYIILMFILFSTIVPIIINLPLELFGDLFKKIPEPYYSIGNMYLLFTLPAFISSIILFNFKDNKKIKSIFSLKNNNILIGILVGYVLNIICVLIAYMCGSIKLAFNDFNLFALIFAFICVFIQSSSEEILCRGYLQNKLLEKYKNPKIAIFANSIVFSLLHIFNDGITIVALLSIFIVGIIFSLVTYYNKSLWEAMFIHTAWNFTQNIILGLPNSGAPSPYSIFKLIESKNSIAYNSVFGVELSITTIIVLIITIVLIQISNKRVNREY